MILEEIAVKTKQRIAERKQEIPLSQLRSKAEALPKDHRFRFRDALAKQGLSFICEVKKASPSKGVIAQDFPYIQIAKEYEDAGADAVSCLTEPYYFQGRDEYLEQIRKEITIPVLRKDFTVDPYMIYEAKLLGADAVLLICAILEKHELREYLEIAKGLGLSALVEAHTERETEQALDAGAEIIGVNNRDLRTFQVDVTTSLRLRSMVPHDRIYVSESGIRTPEDTGLLRENGVDAVLIGETFMRSGMKKELLEQLRGN